LRSPAPACWCQDCPASTPSSPEHCRRAHCRLPHRQSLWHRQR